MAANFAKLPELRASSPQEERLIQVKAVGPPRINLHSDRTCMEQMGASASA
jgi:hypothetical protein